MQHEGNKNHEKRLSNVRSGSCRKNLASLLQKISSSPSDRSASILKHKKIGIRIVTFIRSTTIPEATRTVQKWSILLIIKPMSSLTRKCGIAISIGSLTCSQEKLSKTCSIIRTKAKYWIANRWKILTLIRVHTGKKRAYKLFFLISSGVDIFQYYCIILILILCAPSCTDLLRDIDMKIRHSLIRSTLICRWISFCRGIFHLQKKLLWCISNFLLNVYKMLCRAI